MHCFLDLPGGEKDKEDAEPVFKRPSKKESAPKPAKAKVPPKKAQAGSANKVYGPTWYKNSHRWGVKIGKTEVVSATRLHFWFRFLGYDSSFPGPFSVSKVGGLNLPSDKTKEIADIWLQIRPWSFFWAEFFSGQAHALSWGWSCESVECRNCSQRG